MSSKSNQVSIEKVLHEMASNWSIRLSRNMDLSPPVNEVLDYLEAHYISKASILEALPKKRRRWSPTDSTNLPKTAKLLQNDHYRMGYNACRDYIIQALKLEEK